MSMRLSTRFHSPRISRASQCSAFAVEEIVMREHGLGIAERLEHDRGDLQLVQAQMQDRVVEFARAGERPVGRAELDQSLGVGGRRHPPARGS